MEQWEQYIEMVSPEDADPTVTVGKYARLAVERHKADLIRVEEDPNFDFHFSEFYAKKACGFFPGKLRHSIGEHAGKKFTLEPWQAFSIANIFGWQRGPAPTGDSNKTEGRKYRKVYWSMGRKQGKSTIAAGIAMFMAAVDRNPMTGKPEAQAQVIMAATKREQSEKVILAECIRMRHQSPALKAGSSVANKILTFKHNGGNMQAVGSDRPYDGLNPSLVIMDETHAWTQQHKKFYNTMVTGSGSRTQPLTLTVTTAGDDQSHLWIEEVGHAKAVLDQIVEDEQTYAIVYELDEDDDPFDEETWIKSCPNMGVSISMEFLRGQIRPAKTSPQALNRFRRYHANVLVSSTERIFSIEDFDKCKGTLSDWARDADVVGAGIDLGGRDDLAACAFVARFDTKDVDSEMRPIYRYELKTTSYIAKNTTRDLTAIPFCDFVRDGLLKVTESPMNDLQHDFVDNYWKYYCTDAAIDPYQAQQFGEIVTQEGVTIAAMPQSTRHFNEPIAEFRQAMADGRITHNGDPVLRWCLANAVAVRDRQDRWMLSKKDSASKIDPLVAVIMAFMRAMSGLSKSRGDIYIS